MKSTKSFIYICAVIFLSIALLITGCGGGGGGNPVNPPDPVPDPTPDPTPTPTPDPDPVPSDLKVSSISISETNKVYSDNNLDTTNIAVDVPADGSYYLINLSSNSGTDTNVKLCAFNEKANTRMSVADTSCSEIGEWIYDSNLMARRMFAEAAIAHQNRAKSKASASRASVRCSSLNHSSETVGNNYSIQVGTVDQAPLVILERCKLVKVTGHAKFFVDQTNHGGYYSQAAAMESLITEKGGLADLYEDYMYKVLEDNYGTVADIDGDGKLSVLITSILPTWASGLQGLFPEETMIINPDDYCLDVRNPENNITDFRDLVLIAPPVNNSDEERHTMISNLIHETQHAVNFSQRSFSGNTYEKFNATAFAEELGFDEGCSVCAEALFRRAMGSKGESHQYEYRSGGPSTEYAGNTAKFNNFTIGDVYPFDSRNFNYGAHYGRNGLFMLYIHDCYGQATFKKLINQKWQGDNLKNTIPEILGRKSLDELQIGWRIALQYESLRPEIGKNKNLGKLGYADWLNLRFSDSKKNQALDNSMKTVNSSNNLCYCFKADSANHGGNYRFLIKSADQQTSLKNLVVRVVKAN